MPAPLHLFIQNPANWTLVHSYGRVVPTPPNGPHFYNHTLLETNGDGLLFAAINGMLSVRPPGEGMIDPLEDITTLDLDEPLPNTVTLYLHISPQVASLASFRARTDRIHFFGLPGGFAYLNVETASLEAALAELLDAATIPPGGEPRPQVVEFFLRGVLDVSVTTGHAIGKASTENAPPGSRRAGFTALDLFGPVDASFIYDWLRDFVAEGQPALDAYLRLAPKRWPVLDATLPTENAIRETESSLFPWSVLTELRTSRNLSAAQWRKIGNNQKRLWRNRLLKRVGHAPPDSTDPPFEFDDMDWQNVFQLEAIVEFYANFNDPWRPPPLIDGENRPRSPLLADGVTPNPDYQVVDFLDPAGTSATAAGNVVTLDGNPDLRRVREYSNFSLPANRRLEFRDTIFLENDTARASRLYRITAVDRANHTVTLDGRPNLTGPSAWKITIRPILVVIDSFGGRLRGGRATAQGDRLQLDGLPNPSKINPNFDTIYLPSDTARSSRTYRILQVIRNQQGATTAIVVDGIPNLPDGSSEWHIPAGLSGDLPALVYDLGPGGVHAARGYDHFNGMLFVVYEGSIHDSFRWSSYTSRNYPPPDEFLSSIRGNKPYNFTSYRSGRSSTNYTNCQGQQVGRPFRNYSLRVVDVGATYDGAREARFYFANPVAADVAPPGVNPDAPGETRGKSVIRLHYSGTIDHNGGYDSAGCIVSPHYYALRDTLIAFYQSEYRALNNNNADLEINKLVGRNHNMSMRLYEGCDAGGLADANWNDKIVGTLWLIRPDERPLG